VEISYCSTFYQIYLLMDNVIGTLEEKIQKKIETGSSFPESELIVMAKGIIEGLAFLEKNKISHNNIKASAIYLGSNNTYKVLDKNLDDELSLFMKVKKNIA